MAPLPDFEIPAEHPSSRENHASAPLSPIEAVAEAMVERLKQRLPGSVAVEHFPDKPDEYDFPGHDAAALVIWDGSSFDQAGAVGEQGTREILNMAVALMVRSLRGPSGAYGLKHEIQKALHGQSFAGTTGLRPVKAELERPAENVFQYLLTFEGRLPTLPIRPAGVAMPASARR